MHTTPDFFPSLLDNHLKRPLVTTLHAVAEPYVDNIMSHFVHTNYIALSHAYKKSLIKSKVYDVVYNGVNTDLYSYHEKKDNYLLWIGRISPSKNENGKYIDPKEVTWAIQLAQKTGSQLFMSGTVHNMDFFRTKVETHLSDKIQWVGNPTAEQSVPVEKIVELMQHAKAFLMTVNQEEPFSLVMVESMSCGTPVIAWKRGSVPEIVEFGKTGFYVDPSEGIEALAATVSRLSEIKPIDCRRRVEKMFSVGKMLENYERVYKKISS